MFLPLVIFGFLFLAGMLNVWSHYEQWRFTRFEGKMKRGVKVGTKPLVSEMHQFLEALQTKSLYSEQNFIRKEGYEILLSREHSFWWNFWFRPRDSWPYVAYVDLSASKTQIEFRVSLIYLIILIISPFIMLGPLIWFLGIISMYGLQIPNILWVLLPSILLVIFVVSILFNHYRECNRLLDILIQSMKGY